MSFCLSYSSFAFDRFPKIPTPHSLAPVVNMAFIMDHRAEAHGDVASSMTSADVEVLGAKTAGSIGSTSARIHGEEIYVDLPALAPVGEYELRLYEAKKMVATFPFIVAFWSAFNRFFWICTIWNRQSKRWMECFCLRSYQRKYGPC